MNILQVKTRYHYHINGAIPPELPTNQSVKPWIFVFGSNLAGMHGAGAALKARQTYGARPGVGHGQEAQSYAIPTKDDGRRTGKFETLPLKRIEEYVNLACRYMARRIEDAHERYWFTAIGTGLAGYEHNQIAPLFRQFENYHPKLVRLADHLSFPDEWFEYLEPDTHHEHTLKAELFIEQPQLTTTTEHLNQRDTAL